MLSHAVFTVASLKCMLLVLRFCPSYSGTTPGQPPGNTGGHEPCGQVSTGTPPPPSGLHGARAHPVCSCCTSPNLGPEPGICEPGLLVGCACTGYLALRWWSGPQRTGFCVCVLAVITGSRPEITPQTSLSFRP